MGYEDGVLVYKVPVDEVAPAIVETVVETPVVEEVPADVE